MTKEKAIEIAKLYQQSADDEFHYISDADFAEACALAASCIEACLLASDEEKWMSLDDKPYPKSIFGSQWEGDNFFLSDGPSYFGRAVSLEEAPFEKELKDFARKLEAMPDEEVRALIDEATNP